MNDITNEIVPDLEDAMRQFVSTLELEMAIVQFEKGEFVEHELTDLSGKTEP